MNGDGASACLERLALRAHHHRMASPVRSAATGNAPLTPASPATPAQVREIAQRDGGHFAAILIDVGGFDAHQGY